MHFFLDKTEKKCIIKYKEKRGFLLKKDGAIFVRGMVYRRLVGLKYMNNCAF